MTQGANTTESYSYDPVGNRLSSLGLSPYNVNTSNELTSTPSASYAYDSNGNTTSKTNSNGTTSYTWDYENRLTQVTLPGQGGTVQFKYDPFGRRIYKSSSSATTIYAYDGDNVVETTNSSGGILSRFAQGQNIDEPLAESTSGATDYYEADGLGSITSLTNGTGTIAQTYTYDSFGNVTHSTGSLVNPFQYTARDFDSETGLSYYRARYYDPSVGRFFTEDPVPFVSGLNSYVYVSDRPQNFADPFGLSQQDVNRILNQAQNITNQMTANGERINNGFLNNIVASLELLIGKKKPHLGCGQQADRVVSGLQFPPIPYDDNWQFRVVQVGWHQFGVGTSDNPNDPNLILDPWNNSFYPTPKVGPPLGQ